MGEAEIHELRRLRAGKPFPIPASACRVIGSLGLRAADLYRVSFKLKRCKRGVEIWFSAPTGPNTLFQWNASQLNDVWPLSFTEARRWVHAYAAGLGQIVEEVKPPPRLKMPTGEDRKLFKAGGCKEAWLRSDVPHLWAEAVIRCQHAGSFCGQDGFCHLEVCDMEMDPRTPVDTATPASMMDRCAP